MNRLLACVVALLCTAAAAYPPTFYTPPPRPAPSWCPAPGVLSTRFAAPAGYYWVCTWPPRPQTQKGQLTPTIYITHIVYAVAGRSSSMAYVQGDKVGSTTTAGATFRNGVEVEFDVKANVIVAGGQLNVKAGQEWGSTAKGTVDVTVEQASGYRKLGEVDGVDHDSDEVWFLMNPTLDLAITPESPYGPATVVWSFSASSPGTPYFLYAGEINGHRPMPAGVQETLGRFGVNGSDLFDLRNADPWINNPSKNPATDPARFDLLWQGPYRPVGAAGDQASIQSYSVTRRIANTVEQSSDVTTYTTVKAAADLAFFLLAKTTLSIQDKFTWNQSTGSKNSLETNTANTITVGQPAFGYGGPQVLRIYEDKVFKTYVWQLDWS